MIKIKNTISVSALRTDGNFAASLVDPLNDHLFLQVIQSRSPQLLEKEPSILF